MNENNDCQKCGGKIIPKPLIKSVNFDRLMKEGKLKKKYYYTRTYICVDCKTIHILSKPCEQAQVFWAKA